MTQQEDTAHTERYCKKGNIYISELVSSVSLHQFSLLLLLSIISSSSSSFFSFSLYFLWNFSQQINRELLENESYIYFVVFRPHSPSSYPSPFPTTPNCVFVANSQCKSDSFRFTSSTTPFSYISQICNAAPKWVCFSAEKVCILGLKLLVLVASVSAL